jgi:hypothetical protein
MKTKRARNGLLVIFSICVLLSACESPSGTAQEGENLVDLNPGQTPQFTPETTVCNPWGDSGMAADRGIVARLNYMKPGVCRVADVDDPNTPGDESAQFLSTRPRTAISYIDDSLGFSIPTDVTLFFNKLFIGTRYFDRGFATQDGTVVENAAGNTLYEWFGVEFKTQIKTFDSDSNLLQINPGLQPADYPAGYFEGDYQLAVLSDDGAVVYLETANGLQEIVNNDGEHATKLGCSQQPIHLVRGQKIPIRIQYYQGPRYHISLVLMWRKWPTSGGWGYSQTDQNTGSNRNLCGAGVNFSSNSFYFTPGNANEPAATPTNNFREMLANGWAVLETQNFSLPEEVISNPCTPPEPPMSIAGVAVTSVLSTTATVTWTTSTAAVSYVTVKNLTTGVSFNTAATTQYSTDHVISLSGLSANTLYSIRATSTSPGGQIVTSDEVAFRTRR